MTAAAETEAQADRGCAVVVLRIGRIAVIVGTVCIGAVCVLTGIVAVRVRLVVPVASISVRIGGAAGQGCNGCGDDRAFHQRSHRGLLLTAPRPWAATPVIASEVAPYSSAS